MFSISAISITIVFILSVLGLPFCKTKLAIKSFKFLQKFIFKRSTQVYFYRDSEDNKSQLLWMRAWGTITCTAFTIFAIAHGEVFHDKPLSLASTLAFISLAMAAGAILVITAFSYLNFSPIMRSIISHKKSGIKGTWTYNPGKPPTKFQDVLSTKITNTSSFGIIDVTGHSLLGKDASSSETLLYTSIAAAADVPVKLLLLNPQAATIDHERRHLTIAREALQDMEITEAMFRRKLRSTLESVDDLNAERPGTSRIEVRFYQEKPTVNTIIFDDTAFVSSWNPKETESEYTLFEAGLPGNNSSLFEIFRHQFTRLWAYAVPMQPEIELFLRNGSSVVRKKEKKSSSRVEKEINFTN